MAAIKSKKSKIIISFALDSTLSGMNVAKASRAMSESAHDVRSKTVHAHLGIWCRTLLPHFEKLICFPRYNATSQSAPTPFHDAAEDLKYLRGVLFCLAAQEATHHGFG